MLRSPADDRPRGGLVLAGLLVLTVAAPAGAGSHDLTVLYPGAPGSEEQAARTMELLGSWLEERADWPARAGVRYVPDGEAVRARLADPEPTFAIVSAPVWCVLASGERPVRPLAAAMRDGSPHMRYHVVRRPDASSDPADLAGASLRTVHLWDRPFVDRVILGDEVALDAIEAEPVSRSLRAVRGLLRGEVDAVLLDDREMAALSGLPGGEDLVSIHESPPVPRGIVCAVGSPDGELPEGSRAVTRAFLDMADHETGRRLARALRVDGFAPVDDDSIDRLLERYRP